MKNILRRNNQKKRQENIAQEHISLLSQREQCKNSGGEGEGCGLRREKMNK